MKGDSYSLAYNLFQGKF